jgi:AmmeMemoRadiSam system protein A
MAGALTNRQGEMLLELARKTLAEILTSGTVAAEPDDPALAVTAAAFVTLKIGGKLRGCIGNLEPVGPLWRGVRDNAINAAFHDPRFSPITPEELPAVRLDVSVLSPPKSLEYRETEELPGKLQPGIDGVILRDGPRGATFLPQVWQQLPSPEQFLGHLCMKAGLPKDTWQRRKLEIHIYHVQCFEEDKR